MELTLAESTHFLLVHDCETVYVVDRRSSAKYNAGDHYGDPRCGVIAPDESWFASGGEGIVVWREGSTEECIRRGQLPEGLELQAGGFFAVVAMRVDGSSMIRFLIDPWSDNASVWMLDPTSRELTKLHDGPHLRDQPFQEHIKF